MQLIYNGTDITDDVDIVKCVHRDVSGGRCDLLEIELENANAWYRWQPQRDDVLIAALNGYDTGAMYLNSVLPEAGRYKILATSIPSAARRRAYASYENIRLGDLLASCAAECGMGSALYGALDDCTYTYLERNNESAPAFISRILGMEGAILKTINGKMVGIGIEYAQDLAATQTIAIQADQTVARYLRREEKKLAGITLCTPYATGTAQDSSASWGLTETHADYPATDNAQAGRWARGLLLSRNRLAEELTLEMEFAPSLTAMGRIDIESTTDAAGEWLVEEAEHDLFAGKSTARLVRCIRTIE